MTTKKRFSIWVREYGSDHDVELCQMESDPQAIVTALYAKREKIGGGKSIAKYAYVRVIDHHAAP